MNHNEKKSLRTKQRGQTHQHHTPTITPSQPPLTQWYKTRPNNPSHNDTLSPITQTSCSRYSSHSQLKFTQTESPSAAHHTSSESPKSPPAQAYTTDHTISPTTNHTTHPFVPFGDSIPHQAIPTNTLRLHHLNYNGFYIDSTYSHHGLAQDLWNINDTLHPDILSCNEINLNINNPKVRNSIHQAFKQVYPHYKLSMSHTPDDFGRLRKKPGGTALAIPGHLTSRIKTTGQDTIGRWSYITLTKKDKQLLTIISAYRVSTKFGPHVGHTTIVAQEFRCLIQAGRPQNIDPRKAFITDIITFIKDLQQSQHDIILLMDANEAPNTRDGVIQQLQQECQLYDALTYKYPHPPSPSSYKNGPHRLDYILISDTLLPHVQHITMLPFDHSEVISDHRPMLIDFNFNAVFNSLKVQPNPFDHSRRGVRLTNLKSIDNYQTHLRRNVREHKVIERLTTTQRRLNRTPTQFLIDHFNDLDEEYGRYMIASQRKASKQFNKSPPWSPILHKAGSRVRYWRSRQSSILTDP